MGYIFAIIAGACMSIQGVMNTRLSDKVGLFASNAWVQGCAFVLSLIALIFAKDTVLKGFGEVNKFYLLGGVFGLAITLTVMLSMGRLSPAVAVSAILTAQLICAAVIDATGFMDTPKASFGWNKYIGSALMLGGMLLFKWK